MNSKTTQEPPILKTEHQRMPSLAPSMDEIAMRKQTVAQQKGARKAQASQAEPVAVKPNGGNGLLWTVVVLLIAVIGGGGYFGYEQFTNLRDQITTSQSALEESSSLLDNLESQMQLTGEEQTKMDSQVGKTLKLHDSEIRKLWDLSNKRNKSDIQTNKKSVGTLKTQLGALQTQLKQSQNTVSEQAGVISDQKNTIAALTQQIADLNSALEQSERSDKVWRMEMEDRLATDEIGEKVEANAIAIQSIDFFRQQMNSELERINREIRLLNQKTTAAPGSP